MLRLMPSRFSCVFFLQDHGADISLTDGCTAKKVVARDRIRGSRSGFCADVSWNIGSDFGGRAYQANETGKREGTVMR